VPLLSLLGGHLQGYGIEMLVVAVRVRP